MKLAVIFPGIGYHTDKPLLYYAKKLAAQLGYEIKEVPYGGFPKDVKGSEEKMRQAFLSALSQTEHMLEQVNFTEYEELLFISKSVGTAVAAAYAVKHGLAPAHIYFTPVEASFACMSGAVPEETAEPCGEEETCDREEPCGEEETCGREVPGGEEEMCGREKPCGEKETCDREEPDGEKGLRGRIQSGIVFHGTRDPWVETRIVTGQCEALRLPLYITENANHSMETGDALADLKNLYGIMEICRKYLEGLSPFIG